MTKAPGAKDASHAPRAQPAQVAPRVVGGGVLRSVLGNQAVLRMTDETEMRGDLPRAVRGAFASGGVPLDPSLRGALGARLGADFSGVRIHADDTAAQAARALGARAFTYGTHVGFARGAFAPGTDHGAALLAHELAHVVQQARGDRSGEAAQERDAEHVARGATLQRTLDGPARPELRLRRGDVQSVMITLLDGGAAEFVVAIEASEPVRGSGTATGLAPGSYRVRMGRGGVERMDITAADGSPIGAGSEFHTTMPPQVVRAIAHAHGAIPLVVQASATPAVAVPDVVLGDGGTGERSMAQVQREAIDALPQRIRDFLFVQQGISLLPEDYPAILRIAAAIRDLTDEQLAEYRARTTGSTTNVLQFERGVNAYLTELRARNAAITEETAAAQALSPHLSLYDMLARWQVLTNTSNTYLPTAIQVPIDQLARYEATPFASLHVGEGSTWDFYYEFRRQLAAAGFANIGAFETAIQRYLVAFQEHAFYVALEVLGRYEHFLTEQQARYANASVVDSLYANLATARTTVQSADRLERAMMMSPVEPEDTHGAIERAEERREHRELVASATASARIAAITEPVVSQRDFDPLELARTDRAGVARILTDYITSHLASVRETRTRLQQDHSLIYRFNELVAETKRRAGVARGTVLDRAIDDRAAPRADQVISQILQGIVLLAITLAATAATMGTGLPAVLVALGSFGVSSYFALDAYEAYAQQHDAYAAQLLSSDPWFGWVVIAIVGAGLDLAAVGVSVRALAPAVRAFEEGGSLASFSSAVQQLVHDEAARRAILEAAAARAEARAAWDAVAEAPTIAPRGALRGSAMFGLDLLIDAALAAPRVMYALWLEARAGVRSFQAWLLTREAIQLFGEASTFSPARMREIEAIFNQASADLGRVADHARRLGISTADLDRALATWARNGRGGADQLIPLLDRQAALAIDPAALAVMTREVDVGRVRAVAAMVSDPALRAQLLSDGRVWRALHNLEYDAESLERAWANFQRELPPSRTRDSTSFGDYLYNSRDYRTTIGRPAPQPLTAVIPNWTSLVGAQRTQAVFAAAEPRLAAALAAATPPPGVNPQTLAQLRDLLTRDVIGPGVTMYDGARGIVMGRANAIIAQTTRTESELRAILALVDSSGSIGALGEAFVAQRLTVAAYAARDRTQVAIPRDILPGLRGPRAEFIPDRVIVDAHQTMDIKTGYAGGIDIVDQAHNYELLRALSQTRADVQAAVGGPLRGHSWLVLPGGNTTQASARDVALQIWRQLEQEGLSTQRVFYLDGSGVLQRITGATTVEPAGATIHAAIGLPVPPPAVAP